MYIPAPATCRIQHNVYFYVEYDMFKSDLTFSRNVLSLK